VKRSLVETTSFLRAARRIVKRRPELVESMNLTLEKLADDAFDPSLKTHKLKGELAGSWSCSAGYDLRVVFEFIQHEGSEAILLHSVGTHDEVY
jgi:mRNA-degrading endonuclease YafQ of YafQ-DinJ toxin-antitoxin module